MAGYYETGDSIECKKSEIDTRKCNLQGLIKQDGVKYFRYKTNIRTKVTIISELLPKKSIINKNSHLDRSDFVEAQIVEIWLASKVKFNKKTNTTSTHSSYNCKMNCFTFAKISTPWKHIIEKPKVLITGNTKKSLR